jgi:uncharacterized protein
MMLSQRYEIISDTDEHRSIRSDCDCACATAYLPAAGDAPPTLSLQRHPLQRSLPLDDHYQVVFVPSLSRIAVLNRASRDLLDRFAEPLSLAALPPTEQAAARQLYQLQLLLPPGTGITPSEPDELIAWLHVTNACNLRCTYCYIHKTNDAMDAATARAAVDAIFRVARKHHYQKVALKYAGGEASLNLERVAEIHQHAAEWARDAGIGLRAVILSNGVALRQAALEQIQRLGLDLMISLDGPARVHDRQRPRMGGQGSFAAASAAILQARALGIPLTVSVTVTGSSVAALPELLAWLLQHDLHFTLNFYRACDARTGIAELRLDEARMIEGMRAAYRRIETQLPSYSLLGSLLDRSHLGAPHRRTCAVGENYLVIDHTGRVARCQMSIDQPITSIWDADPLIPIRQDPASIQNLPVDEKQGCRDCAWKYWCAGGCAVETFRATGRYDVQSPNCTIYQALYPEVIRLEGLRLLRRHRRTEC